MSDLEKYQVAMAQIWVEGGSPDRNLARARDAIARAASQGCRLVVLPECTNLGWTHPSARSLARAIPGEHFDSIASAAAEHGIYVVAGLVERAGDQIFNAAVLVDPEGRLLLRHRKINELDIALDLYSTGDRLGVVSTELGTLGINVCADNFPNSLAIAHVLARMGAQVILSPCAWAVDADHDNRSEPYGKLWMESYGELTRLYDVTVIGVSNVGWLDEGPWKGRKVIGCSLAVGPGGEILAQGPYGHDAEALIPVCVSPQRRKARGTLIAEELKGRGYTGP